MKRFLALVFAVALLLAAVAPGASAQETAVDLETLFGVLFDPQYADQAGVVVINPDGTVDVLTEGHAPIDGDPLTIDFTGARGAIDDTGDGADPDLDIVRGWGNMAHVSDAALAYFTPGFDGFSPSDAFGFATPFDGTTPAFPAESVVLGVETAEPVTDEFDPIELRVNLQYQFNLTFTRSGAPVYESNDSNGGHNGSIDMYLLDGRFGIGSFDFPGGDFRSRTTEFSGRARGNLLNLFGPWGELDGASGFELNIVDFPNFDTVELGDLPDFGTIDICMFSEMDINGDGVYDPLEAGAEQPVEEPAGEPAPQEPAVVEEPATPAVDESQAVPEPVSAEAGGGNTLIIVIAVLLLLGGIAGLILFLRKREQEKCVPEAEALANAKARVAERETRVDNAKSAVEQAREHLEYTEANAREQREQRLVEAQQRVDAAEGELALAEGRLSDARAEEEAAQYAYDVCMGFITPAPEPEPVVTAPSGPPPRPEMPGPPPTEVDTGRPGVVVEDDGDTAGGATSTAPPPPKSPPECADGQTREVDGPVESFTVPVDGNVRFSLSTGEGPLDDVSDLVSTTPIADQIAEFLTPGSIGVSATALSPGNARSLQSTLERLASTARTEIELVISYDLEDVSLVCIRLDECQHGHWVTVGHRLEERGRTQRTVTTRRETVSSDRPLGATFTEVRRGLAKASDSKAQMDQFSARCN